MGPIDRVVAALCLFTLMGLGTFQRNAEWQDPLVLWRSASRLAPLHARPRLNVAHQLTERRDFSGARQQYDLVLLQIQIGRTPLYQSNARNAALTNLGLLNAIEGRYVESERLLNLVIAEWPNLPQARVNRGLARLAQNRCQDAREDFQSAGLTDNPCVN